MQERRKQSKRTLESSIPLLLTTRKANARTGRRPATRPAHPWSISARRCGKQEWDRKWDKGREASWGRSDGQGPKKVQETQSGPKVHARGYEAGKRRPSSQTARLPRAKTSTNTGTNSSSEGLPKQWITNRTEGILLEERARRGSLDVPLMPCMPVALHAHWLRG
jgi:hypothetical protein